MSAKKKFQSLFFVSLGGIGAFTGISIYKENEKFYKDFLMPAIHLFDPETAHRLAVLVSKHRLLPKTSFVDPSPLKVRLFDREFSNPIGIAAGFDKHGEAVMGLNDIGFGFVEIGSVTPRPQAGNDKPRVFRLREDKAVINRYGFNSDGHELVHERLSNLKQNGSWTGILGINLGKNKESEDAAKDYVSGIRTFGPLADYLVINISSPNTVGLRNLQAKSQLKSLLSQVVQARDSLEGSKPPLLLKLAPDLSPEERKDVADVIKLRECKVDGLIISNTTIQGREELINDRRMEAGGISGAPVKDLSTQMITDMYKLTNKKIPIIGVGGVSNGADAYEKIKAGASIIQIYTALIYEGPPVVTRIKKELVELLKQDQFASVEDAIGANVK